MQTASKRLKPRTSNLTCLFPGAWPLIFLEKMASVKIHLAEICTVTNAF